MEGNFAEWNRRGDETWAGIVDEVRERHELIGGDFIQQIFPLLLHLNKRKRTGVLIYSSPLISTKESKSIWKNISVCDIFKG